VPPQNPVATGWIDLDPLLPSSFHQRDEAVITAAWFNIKSSMILALENWKIGKLEN